MLLVSLALVVLGAIAEKRWMGVFLVVLGLAVWGVVAVRAILFWKDDSALAAIAGFTIIGAVISNLIAVSVWRRRVVPPRICVRNPVPSKILRIMMVISLVVMTAFVDLVLVSGSFRFHRDWSLLGIWAFPVFFS